MHTGHINPIDFTSRVIDIRAAADALEAMGRRTTRMKRRRRSPSDQLQAAGINVVENGIELIRTNVDRNMNRFYLIRYDKTLFGEWLLTREWGRVGKNRQVLTTPVKDYDEAVRQGILVAAAKLRKGYAFWPRPAAV